ncbi:protein kinase [Sulfurimonas sp. MAG313]|nr:leucine-rich repeat-containing protein kinase family protein [Sulfurimonas sp. MAG313]MDF1879890.1 protein kinase [Sulfurimonas sp. MAG313]
MQTLSQLQSGQLHGIKKLQLKEELTHFPEEIFTLSHSLEILDLSGNNLCELPDLSPLKKLKIAFFSYNDFKEIPSVFKRCENLYMLGFKANKIECFDEDILPLSISWLILTDNKIKELPRSIGKLSLLQKCALAGNEILKLPLSMKKCRNLELLRLSANNLEEFPSFLLTLPKLSWLAFSGNPFCEKVSYSLQEHAYEDLDIQELLGEGASGEIYKAYSKTMKKEVAFKLFKGAVTSDGYAKDEMNAYMSTGEHEGLIKVLAKLQGANRLGLILELIPKSFTNLGLPPSLETCTRDTFKDSASFSLEGIITILKAICTAAIHLHSKGLMHGDLYAHNILVNEEYKSYLGDFGAASFYDTSKKEYEQLEVRAFGCLMQDLLNLCHDKEGKKYFNLKSLAKNCMQENVQNRPLFQAVFTEL